MSDNEEETTLGIVLNNLQKIRSNMAVVRGMGEYMKRFSEDSEAIKGMANDCEDACKELHKLIDSSEKLLREYKKEYEVEY
jgi:hypothetical protein